MCFKALQTHQKLPGRKSHCVAKMEIVRHCCTMNGWKFGQHQNSTKLNCEDNYHLAISEDALTGSNSNLLFIGWSENQGLPGTRTDIWHTFATFYPASTDKFKLLHMLLANCWFQMLPLTPIHDDKVDHDSVDAISFGFITYTSHHFVTQWFFRDKIWYHIGGNVCSPFLWFDDVSFWWVEWSGA